jgi:hypothetical protein
MALTMHAETVSKAMEAVQTILTFLDFRDGISRPRELSVEVHMTGSHRPAETAPGLEGFQWSSTVETESSGS